MKLLFILLCICHTTLFAQDLLKERIRKLSSTKSSIYIEKGIFHNGGVNLESSIKAIRQFDNAKQGFERIVIDFNTSTVPKIYGHISAEDKKIYIDFFETTLAKDMQAVAKTRHIEKLNIFPIEENYLSVEFKLKSKVSADIFYLDNPGRLVIDLKN